MKAKHKEFIHYFLLEGRCSSISRKAGSVMCNGFLGRENVIMPNIPPLSFLYLQLLLLSMTPLSMGHPLGQLRSVVLVLPGPPSSLCTPRLIAGRAAQEA